MIACVTVSLLEVKFIAACVYLPTDYCTQAITALKNHSYLWKCMILSVGIDVVPHLNIYRHKATLFIARVNVGRLTSVNETLSNF